MMRRIHDVVRIVSQINLIEKSNSTGKNSSYVWKNEDLSKIKTIDEKKEQEEVEEGEEKNDFQLQPYKKRKVEELKFKKILPKFETKTISSFPLIQKQSNLQIQQKSSKNSLTRQPKDFDIIISPVDEVNYYFNFDSVNK